MVEMLELTVEDGGSCVGGIVAFISSFILLPSVSVLAGLMGGYNISIDDD